MFDLYVDLFSDSYSLECFSHVPVLHLNFSLSSTKDLRVTCLQVTLLVCHRFTDGGRRLEMPGSEAKNSFQLTVTVADRVSAFIPVSQTPIPAGQC